MGTREYIGRIWGGPSGLLMSFGSLIRNSQLFHPREQIFSAIVEPVEGLSGKLLLFSCRLSGPALVGLSNAIWKGRRERVDTLSFAMRIGWKPGDPLNPAPTTQDLIFATARSPWTFLFAPLTTRVHNFMSNYYFALSPFWVSGIGRTKFRLTPIRGHRQGTEDFTENGNRQQALELLVKEGRAVFGLEMRALGMRKPWIRIANVKLLERVDVDRMKLRFSPFQSGRGIQPLGLMGFFRGSYSAGINTAR